MRTALMITFLFTSIITALDEAWSEQLSIGPVVMGMQIDDVIGREANECSIEGMLIKYKICTQPIVVQNVPLSIKYFFDIDSKRLVALHAEFSSAHYDFLKKYIDKKYNIISSEVESLYGGNKLIEYRMSSGYFILKYKEHGNFGSIYMMSAEGESSYTRKIDEYFKKE